MSGTPKGKLWIILPLRRDHCRSSVSRRSHLACATLKTRWISWVDYESLSPPWHVCPPTTAHTHPLCQYLVNCHIFMRSMNITGVTNYSLSMVQESGDRFLFIDWQSYMLFQAHNLNVSHQPLLLLWRGNTADQNLLQFNGFLCSGRNIKPFWGCCINSPALCRLLWMSRRVFLLPDDAPWSEGPSFVFADKIGTNAIWSWCTRDVCSFEWNLDDYSLTYGILFWFQCRFGYKASVCITVIGHYSLRIGCLLSTCISTIFFSP